MRSIRSLVACCACTQKGNAITIEPDELLSGGGDAIDWLLIDVICVPEQLAAMLNKWLANQRCRRFVATIKVFLLARLVHKNSPKRSRYVL